MLYLTRSSQISFSDQQVYTNYQALLALLFYTSLCIFELPDATANASH